MKFNRKYYTILNRQERARYLLEIGITAQFSLKTLVPKYVPMSRAGGVFAFLGEFDSEEEAIAAAEKYLKEAANA